MGRRSHPAADADDGELLERAAGGEADAFGQFYDRFEESLLAFFRRATGRADLAADLTAETFAAALESADGYRRELGPARGWLFGIARHQLADALSRGYVEDAARRRLQIEALVLSDAQLASIDRELSGDAGAADLLDGLPADQRDAIVGRVLDDRSYDDLAAQLRCSPSVVRQRVSRGLRTLRSRMEQTR